MPLPISAGCSTVESVSDTFWHPLRCERWASVVNGTRYVLLPQAMVATRGGHPVQEVRGLAMFTLGHGGPSRSPALFTPDAPLLCVGAGPAVTLDLPVDSLPRVFGVLRAATFLRGASWGPAGRSPLATKEYPRVRLDLAFAVGTAEMDVAILMAALQTKGLVWEVLWGSHSMFAGPTAKIMEATHPQAFPQQWARCMQMLPRSATTALMTTALPPED